MASCLLGVAVSCPLAVSGMCLLIPPVGCLLEVDALTVGEGTESATTQNNPIVYIKSFSFVVGLMTYQSRKTQ